MKIINVIAAIFLLIPHIVIAKDLGKHGHNFQIGEEGLTRMMEQKLSQVDMAQERTKMENIAKERVENPKTLAGVTKAKESRTFYYDPTYTLAEDAVLPCGKILHKAGTTINPLEYMSLDRRLFFLDGSDAEQVKWLMDYLKNLQEGSSNSAIENRVILVGGSPIKMTEALNMEVYFDQHSELIKKFGIKAFPSIVIQDGLELKIEEIVID